MVKESIEKSIKNGDSNKCMKPGITAGPSEVCAEISSDGEVSISVIMELRQRMLNGKGLQDEWQTSALVPIFTGKEDVKIAVQAEE